MATSFGTGTTASTLNSVTLVLANPTAGAASVALYTDTANQPGVLVGTLVSPSNYSSSLANAVFTSNTLPLAANSTYWVVLFAPTGEFDWSYTADNAGSGVGFQHTFGQSSDAGVNWFTGDIFPYQASVVVAPVPEPGAVVLFAAAVGGFGAVARFLKRRFPRG